MVPVYHNNFTHEEIKGLLQFYATPLGKKVIQTLPAVVQQSMAAGQNWSESMMVYLIRGSRSASRNSSSRHRSHVSELVVEFTALQR